MLTLILFLNTVFTVNASATEPDLVIQQLDANYPVEQIKGKGVEIRKAHSQEQSPADPDEQVPTPEQTDHWISEAKLSDVVKDWDQFAKDELVIRASLLDEKALAKKYPAIDTSSLKKLKDVVRAARKSAVQKKGQP